jgi:hypothetical protein
LVHRMNIPLHHLVDNQRATFLNSKRVLVTVAPAISLVLLVQIGYLFQIG